MSKSSEIEMKHEKEIGNIVQQFIYRLPKKMQLEKQFIDGFRRNGGLHYEVFQLNGTENMMEWTNISCRLTLMKRFGLSKYTIEIISSEMNSWQYVKKMKI
jgi:hypothetical protein